MGPKTNILQNYGTQIHCKEYLLVAFHIDSERYGIALTLREIKKPQTLKLSGPKTTKALNIVGAISILIKN